MRVFAQFPRNVQCNYKKVQWQRKKNKSKKPCFRAMFLFLENQINTANIIKDTNLHKLINLPCKTAISKSNKRSIYYKVLHS